ncbi:unnamed protein product [Pieris brassicae]|uniref:Uncharacterized protein n=1 Tax=Pieris brassicae TaxID=7116 RepID=A0A9P0TIK8_PIEBR|nr:unnamed protein product [Pieris brassicae]
MIVTKILYLLIPCVMFVRRSLQICLEEASNKGLSVRWPQSEEGTDIKSDPLCYNEDTIITRNCVNNTWIPSLSELTPCFEALHIFDIPQSSLCPATFKKVSENNTKYCYKVEKASSWSFPCLQGGGASVITHLNDDDVESILTALKKNNVSRYYWLPGRRAKLFSALIWNTPGQMWGRNVESNNLLPVRDCIFKNCLLLDIEAREIISELCWIEYPSLCFYRNDIHYPANCPENYSGVRLTPQESICAGINVMHKELSFEEFSNISQFKCTPMGDNIENDLSRYVYKEIAKNYPLPENTWCWFSTSFYNHVGDEIGIFKSVFSDFRVSINNKGSIRLNRKQDSTKLSCFACRTQILYEQPELLFEYNEMHNIMYLTIYFPSGLWKYSENDTGIQCFSDAKGFVKVIDINNFPYMHVKTSKYQDNTNFTIEKVVYKVDLITDRSAQYWCEGHTNNFTLISTEKVIANPQGNYIHVFSLGLEIFFTDDEIRIELNEKMIQVCDNVTDIFNADKVLLMEMLTYASEKLLVLLHMHMPIMNIYEEKGDNIKMLYENMKQIAKTELFKYNYTFVNISSSMYCLPTTSNSEGMILEWELTAIGHIAAPKQFCLQANGLPVKRRCLGSYILGSRWGQVEGVCNQNYSPSIATTYLYKFYKGRMPANDTFQFLTNGLGYILNDVGIFIPADIYYLSISLQQILNIAQSNESSVDMGTMENIAWIMNRVMILDNRYLRLAQTLNSTNVILDAVGVIIHKLARRNTSTLRSPQNIGYDLARQPNFLIQICYPTINNISGVAIRYKTNTSNFLDVDIIPLFKNTTYDEVLMISNLDIATWIPGNVLDSLIISQNLTSNETLQEENIRIIISIFHNGAVFQELDPNYLILNSRVIGVTIPGFLPNLLYPIPLIFRNLNNLGYKKQCGYWDFMVKNRASGFWSISINKAWRAIPANQASYALRDGNAEDYDDQIFKTLLNEEDRLPRGNLQSIKSMIRDFSSCQDDFGLKPPDGVLKEHTFPWLGFVQYIHVTTGLPHHSKAPRVVLVHKQFAVGTATDMLHLPKNYKLGNVLFGDYVRDEEECGLTLSQTKMGSDCPRAYLEIPLIDISPHPEYSRFGVGNSLAIVKLLRPIKSRKYYFKFLLLSANLGSEGVTHVLCTSGCGIRPGAPIVTHATEGTVQLMGVAAGSAPCIRRSMRNRLNKEPPLYIDVYPYVSWIINFVTANILPRPYPENFKLVDGGPSVSRDGMYNSVRSSDATKPSRDACDYWSWWI